jgi:hypothetical protein
VGLHMNLHWSGSEMRRDCVLAELINCIRPGREQSLQCTLQYKETLP